MVGNGCTTKRICPRQSRCQAGGDKNDQIEAQGALDMILARTQGRHPWVIPPLINRV